MQLQETHLPNSPGLQPAPLQTASSPQTSWQTVPFHWLQNYELIDSQFSSYQLNFYATIALVPSNDRFRTKDSALTLMPVQAGRKLQVDIGDRVQEIKIQFQCSQPTTFSLTDAQECCTAVVEAPESDLTETTQTYTVQQVNLKLSGASTLRIEAKAPVVLTAMHVNRL